MSERYNIPASDVLGENYNITTIECSDYNPNIDNNITVTITVKDVYGDAVSGESVLVTASEGNFTQLNGSNITNASSVTGTTNSSGQFTLTYSCTEWGLITFSANNAIATISTLNPRITNLCKIKQVSISFGSINAGSTSTKTATVTACPSGYSYLIIPRVTSWCIISSSSLNNTTLSVTGMNVSGSSHTCSAIVNVIYYPSSWDI